MGDENRELNYTVGYSGSGHVNIRVLGENDIYAVTVYYQEDDTFMKAYPKGPGRALEIALPHVPTLEDVENGLRRALEFCEASNVIEPQRRAWQQEAIDKGKK